MVFVDDYFVSFYTSFKFAMSLFNNLCSLASFLSCDVEAYRSSFLIAEVHVQKDIRILA